MNTGLPATLASLTGKNPSSLETELKNIIEYSLNTGMSAPMVDVPETLAEYSLEDFDFYIDYKGEIILTFPTYTFFSGADGPTVINTEIFINTNR